MTNYYALCEERQTNVSQKCRALFVSFIVFTGQRVRTALLLTDDYIQAVFQSDVPLNIYIHITLAVGLCLAFHCNTCVYLTSYRIDINILYNSLIFSLPNYVHPSFPCCHFSTFTECTSGFFLELFRFDFSLFFPLWRVYGINVFPISLIILINNFEFWA